jgi:transposase
MAKALSEKEYLLIKDALIEGNKSYAQIAAEVGRGIETVARAKKTETFTEYQAIMRASMARWRQPGREATAQDAQTGDVVSMLRKEQKELNDQFDMMVATLLRIRGSK